jgi:LacI family transcriptional regulator
LHRLVGKAPYKNIHSTITVEMFDPGRLSELPGLLDGSRFNGAIITNTVAEDDSFIAQSQFAVPVVLIGRDIPNYSSVRDSPEKTGQEAAEILVSADSKNLAVLRASLLTQTTSGRLKGFLDRAQSLRTKDPSTIITEGFDEKDGYQAMKRFLAGGPRIDGLYSVMDTLAVGAYHAIKESGLGIPQDVAVVGTGDYAVASYLDPPLSTFTRSHYSMQEEAVRLLLGHLTGEIRTPTNVLIPTSAVLRESTQRGQLSNP